MNFGSHDFQQLFSDLIINQDSNDSAIIFKYLDLKPNVKPEFELITQGHFSDTLYLVCSGLLSVEVETSAQRINLGLIGPGQWVGDISFIEPGPATATVRILEKSTLFCISNNVLPDIRHSYPRTAARLLHALSVKLSKRLRLANNFAATPTEKLSQEFNNENNLIEERNWYTGFGRWLLGIRTNQIDEHAERIIHKERKTLNQKYKQLCFLEREHVLKEERERILEELHDGVGGQLVAMLAILDNEQVSPDALKDIVKASLDDLRLMIDSLDSIEGDVSFILGMFRSRIEPRLAKQNIHFDWQVTEIPPVPNLGPQEVLQIFRILQEIVTNIIKHANADIITVATDDITTQEGKHYVRIKARDNGKGFSNKGNSSGKGLKNMLRRGHKIGGSVQIESTKSGTTVTLLLPVTPLH